MEIPPTFKIELAVAPSRCFARTSFLFSIVPGKSLTKIRNCGLEDIFRVKSGFGWCRICLEVRPRRCLINGEDLVGNLPKAERRQSIK